MERKFKVGDKIVFDESAVAPRSNFISQAKTDTRKFIGKICEVTAISIDADGYPRVDIKTINDSEVRPQSYEWRWKKFNGKIVKPMPIKLHIALKNNSTIIISGVKNSYQEAEDSAKTMLDANDAYTIYKLVPIAKIQNAIKIEKVRTNGRK